MKNRCRMFLLSFFLCGALCTFAQAADGDMLRVGLKYGSEAMSAANLQNYSAFGGYALGYFDAGGDFEELGELPRSYEKITVTTDETYHAQLPDAFYDYDDAARAAVEYSDGFAAYEGGAFYVRVGSYGSLHEAESAAYRLGGEAVGGSRTGVTVVESESREVLFEFDCGGDESLGILPIETREKTVMWFRGYRYYGGFEYQRARGGNINVINVVDMEDYVKGVVPWEMNKDWPVEALKAQAVCARTYAACQSKHRSQGFDICATTHCQVYQGTAQSSANSDAAVEQTAGEYLYYDGRLVQEAVYCSSNGGASEDSLNIWGSDVGYLKGKIDPYEGKIASIIPRYNWSTTYSISELTSLLNSRGYGIGTVRDAYVSAYTDTGNVYSVTFVGTNGSKTVSREACRTLLNLRSQRFSINGGGSGNAYRVNDTGEGVALNAASAIDGSGRSSALSGNVYVITASGTSQLEQRTTASNTGGFVISGSGYGHHVGMSQWGAYSMADLGYSYRDILQFYYTDTTIR